MYSKRLKINWEELEDAFNSQQDDVAYLDRVTGHVVLEGEGDDDLEDEEGYAGQRGGAGVPAQPADDPTRVPVTPPDTAQKIEWLKVFLDQEGSAGEEVRRQLFDALTAEDPAEEIAAILRDNPTERDAWFLYRAERLRELIDAWLSENGIEPVDPAPWH